MKITLENILEIISLLILIISVLIAARQLYLLRKVQKENYDWNKRIEAQKACVEFDYQLINDRKALAKDLDYGKDVDRIPAQKFESIFEKNFELRISCHNILNFFDGLCVGIHNHIYDEQIIKDNFETLILRTYDQFKPYIDERNKFSGNSFCSFMKIYSVKWSAAPDKAQREDAIK